jgi:hypothetical protein
MPDIHTPSPLAASVAAAPKPIARLARFLAAMTSRRTRRPSRRVRLG